MNESKTVALTFNIRFKPGYTGVLVGQCEQLPFIIVEGKTEKELVKNVTYEMNIYFKTFPAEGIRILEQYGKVVQPEEEKHEISGETGSEWTGMKIQVPIPVSR